MAVLLAAVVLLLRPATPAAPQAAPAAAGSPVPPNVKGRLDAPVEIEEWGDFQ